MVEFNQLKDDSYTPIHLLKGEAIVRMPGTGSLDRKLRQDKDSLRKSKALRDLKNNK